MLLRLLAASSPKLGPLATLGSVRLAAVPIARASAVTRHGVVLPAAFMGSPTCSSPTVRRCMRYDGAECAILLEPRRLLALGCNAQSHLWDSALSFILLCQRRMLTYIRTDFLANLLANWRLE